jgi:Calcineurin-like phosphoesterase
LTIAFVPAFWIGSPRGLNLQPVRQLTSRRLLLAGFLVTALVVGVALVTSLAGAASEKATATPIVVWAVGDGPNPNPATRTKEVVDFLAQQKANNNLNDLLWLGDIYSAPDDKTFDQRYGSTYGQFAKETHPTPGNHELKATVPLKPYDDYWRRERPFVAGRANKQAPGGYDNLYAANLGNGWRLLGLTSSFVPSDRAKELPETAPPQVQDVVSFVAHDLDTHTGTCYIAIMHRPRYSAGGRASGQNTDLQAVWQTMAGRVDLYLAGHEHEYFRLNPSKIPDFYPATGVPNDNDINKRLVHGAQAFVVGTGGITLDWLDQPGSIFEPHFPGLEKYLVAPHKADSLSLNYYGALRLSLTNGAASWSYEKLDGTVFDSGDTQCTPVKAKVG